MNKPKIRITIEMQGQPTAVYECDAFILTSTTITDKTKRTVTTGQGSHDDLTQMTMAQASTVYSKRPGVGGDKK